MLENKIKQMQQTIIPKSSFDPLEPWEEFDIAITKGIYHRSGIAKKMGLAASTFSNILKGRSPLTEENRQKLNEILGTNI